MFLEEYDVMTTVGSIMFNCIGLKNCFVDVYTEVFLHTRCFKFLHRTATTGFHSGIIFTDLCNHTRQARHEEKFLR